MNKHRQVPDDKLIQLAQELTEIADELCDLCPTCEGTRCLADGEPCPDCDGEGYTFD